MAARLKECLETLIVLDDMYYIGVLSHDILTPRPSNTSASVEPTGSSVEGACMARNIRPSFLLVSGDGEVKIGDGEVKSGDDGEVKSGDGEVKSGDGEVKSGDGEVKSGDGEVKSGDDGEVKRGDGEVKSGGGEVKSGDGEVKSEDGEVKSGDGEVKSRGCEVKNGDDSETKICDGEDDDNWFGSIKGGRWEVEIDSMYIHGKVLSSDVIEPIPGAGCGFVKLRRGSDLLINVSDSRENKYTHIFEDDYLNGGVMKDVIYNYLQSRGENPLSGETEHTIEGVSNARNVTFRTWDTYIRECFHEANEKLVHIDELYRQLNKSIALIWDKLLEPTNERSAEDLDSSIKEYQDVWKDLQRVSVRAWSTLQSWLERMAKVPDGQVYTMQGIMGCQLTVATIMAIEVESATTIKALLLDPTYKSQLPHNIGGLRYHYTMCRKLYTRMAQLAFAIDKGNHNQSFDCIISFHLSFWPDNCSSWLDRLAIRLGARQPYDPKKENGEEGSNDLFVPFTKSQMLELLRVEGCHLVPKPSSVSPETHHLQWRFSFSVAEYILARCRSVKQRKSYYIFKLLYYYHLKEIKVSEKSLPSYFVKTIMLWMCEVEEEAWWNNKSEYDIVLALLDKLLTIVKRKELEHYFLPNTNLYEQLNLPEALRERVLVELNKLVVQVKEKPRYIEMMIEAFVRRWDMGAAKLYATDPIIDRWCDVLPTIDKMVEASQKIRQLYSKLCDKHVKKGKDRIEPESVVRDFEELVVEWKIICDKLRDVFTQILALSRHHLLVSSLNVPAECYSAMCSSLVNIVHTLLSPYIVHHIKIISRAKDDKECRVLLCESSPTIAHEVVTALICTQNNLINIRKVAVRIVAREKGVMLEKVLRAQGSWSDTMRDMGEAYEDELALKMMEGLTLQEAEEMISNELK